MFIIKPKTTVPVMLDIQTFKLKSNVYVPTTLYTNVPATVEVKHFKIKYKLTFLQDTY